MSVRRVTRSMTGKDRPTPKDPKPKVDDSNFDPLGFFCILPTEIMYDILSSLPTKTIANLAMASQAWQNVLRNWIESKQTLQRLVREISCHLSRIPENARKDHRQKSEEYILGLAGDLVRRVIMSKSMEEKVEWVEKLLKRFMETWPRRGGEYRYLGFFLKSVLKALDEDDEDILIAVESVCSRLHLRLLSPNGLHPSAEDSRVIIHDVFPEKRLILAAADHLCGKYSPFDKADFIHFLFISRSGDTEYHLIGSLLNMWWKRDPEGTISTLEILLRIPEPWGHFPVASLMAELKVDLAVRLLEDDFDKMQRVLKAMAELNGEATVAIIRALRKDMTDAESNALVRYMWDCMDKEIDIVQKRARMTFSADSKSLFEQLHHMEVVKTATGKMRLTPGLPVEDLLCVDLHQHGVEGHCQENCRCYKPR